MLPSTTKKQLYNALVLAHIGCMAGVLKTVEAEVRESAELWYEIDFVTTTPDA